MKYLNLALLLITVCLTTVISFSQSWPQLGNSIPGEGAMSQFGKSVDINALGNSFIGGSWTYSPGGITFAGSSRVFEWNGIDWIQKGQSILGDTTNGAEGKFSTISGDGSTIAVGGDVVSNFRGRVRVYDWDGSNWQQKGNQFLGQNLSQRVGANDLSYDGNTVVIGSYGGGVSNQGLTRIYDWNGSSWVQKGGDILGEFDSDYEGWWVSISDDGNRIATTSANNATSVNEGKVRIFEWNGSSWSQMGSTLNTTAPIQTYGRKQRISGNGNRIIIGAPGTISDPGVVRVFDWDGTNWIQLGVDLTDANYDGMFGDDVSISYDGNVIAIGNPDDGFGSDCVGYVFFWNGSAWVAVGDKIISTNDDEFGHALSINADGSVLAVSAFRSNANGSYSGDVRVYGSPSSVIEESSHHSVHIYPSITSNEFTIEGESGKKLQVEIINPTGNLIMKFDSTLPQTTVDLSNHPSGIYLVSIASSDRRVVYRVVKQ